MERSKFYDQIVIGGGPAGLSASTTGESEGVNTLLLENDDKVGGQAGTSSLIENYPGFPDGISGAELADRFRLQACKFTTDIQVNLHANTLHPIEKGFEITGETNEGIAVVRGRTVLICAGVEYRELNVPGINDYLGKGVEYGSPDMSYDYSGKEIYLVGGANSAGQAARLLAKYDDCNVHLLIRGDDVRDKMSMYLCDRIDATPNIHVHTQTEVVAVGGDDHLREAVLSYREDERTVALDGLFIMIGALPKVDWLPADVTRDEYGYIVTGGDIDEQSRLEFEESNGRSPLAHETSLPGVFAAGDVRSGTIKRVASAVGDGATSIPDIHKYLASLEKA